MEGAQSQRGGRGLGVGGSSPSRAARESSGGEALGVEMYRRRPERRVRARGATAGGVALVYLLPSLPVRVPLWGRFCSPLPSASTPESWVVPGRCRQAAA